MKPVEPNKAHWRKSWRRDFLFFKNKKRNQLELAQGFNDPSSAGCSPALVHAGHLGRGLPAGNVPVPIPFPMSGARCPSVPAPEKGDFWWLNTKEVMAGFFGLLLYCLF